MRIYYIILGILLFLPVPPVWAQDNPHGHVPGTLIVTVTNDTPDGHSTVGDPVTVSIYQNQKLIDTLWGTVNEEAKVVFEGIHFGENLIALASCDHEKVTFQGHSIDLNPAQTNRTTQVRVYDVSPDHSELSIITHHIIIKRGEDFLGVSEYMRLKNSSHMAIRSDKLDSNGKPVVMEVFLPRGHRDFQPTSYFAAEALVFTDNGFYDTMPVAPGEYDIQFSYLLDIDSETMDFAKEFPLPTDDLVFFIALPVAKATGLGPSSEFTMADGKVSEYYPLGPRQPGEQLKFQLTGFKLPKSDRSWIIIAVIFSHIGILIIWRLRKK